MRSEIFSAASLINQKDPDEAIRILESLNDDDLGIEDAGMKHLHLGIAFGKKKDVERSNHHYRKAIEYGHPSGMAYEKLAINLAKQGKLEEAIEVCQRLVSHPKIPKPRSYLTKDDMRKRKERLEARLRKDAEKE